jgi:hypothetical protein
MTKPKKPRKAPLIDVGDVQWLVEQRKWFAAGKPSVTPLACLDEAMQLTYQKYGALAAAQFAKELAPYVHARLSAVAQVSKSEIKEMSDAELFRLLSAAFDAPAADQ